MKKNEATGYGLVIIDKKREKARVQKMNAFETNVQGYIDEGELYELFAEEVLEASEKNTRDGLVLATYSFKVIESKGFEYTDYEDDITILTTQLVKRNYQEFWRNELAIKLTFEGSKFGSVESLIAYHERKYGDTELQDEVMAWEEFYEEELIFPLAYQNKEEYQNHLNAIKLKSLFK